MGRASWVLCSAVCLLVFADRAVMAQTGATQHPAAERTEVDCGKSPDGRPVNYWNARFGLSMTYPPSFVLDPNSIPETGDSAQFWTLDRQATAIVTGLHNGLGQSLSDLFEEAKRDVTANSGGVITYTRIKDDWFVLSGFMAGRIFYRRTVLAQEATLIGNLWIEFPSTMRPCFDGAVTMMSLSFRHTDQ